MKVVKRDNTIVDFDGSKIVNAIKKANTAVTPEETIDEKSIYNIMEGIKNCHKERLLVEDIQDIVEHSLMKAGKFELAKQYIIYRYKRALVRKANTTDESILSLIKNDNKELMEENSNKNAYIASTQRDLIAGEVSKDITKRIILPEKISKAHEDGILHFHDMDYFIQPIFNCFSSSTRFVTDRGVLPFSAFRDGEQVRVLTKDGFWSVATVRYFGKQKLYDVYLRAGRTTKKVTCTLDHRWLLRDGTITTNLKIGDTLYPLQDSHNNYVPTTKRDCEMFAFGFILGDGHDIKKGVFGRLCGQKIKYAQIFENAGYKISKVKDSDNDLYIASTFDISKQDFLSYNGWRYLSLEDKIMLFAGYYAADGCTNKNMIHTADDRLALMITEISALAGYHIASYSERIVDTNFKNNARLHQFSFIIYQNNTKCWKVDNIVPHRNGTLEQEIWCVEEPKTHTFTLDGGIVTGNCCLINIGDMLDNGTVMNGKMIESPRSFQVACTVMTQIIAAVASSQYGGQSVDVSHLGKYLRRSKEKFKHNILETINDIDEKLLEILVNERVKTELQSGVQTIQYQINTLMTTNGQSPFVTLFLNLKEDDPYIEENAMIIEEILRQRLQGIKNDKGVYNTPAFPKLVYVLDEHNCLKGGKYDYITKLAVKCSAKRMYPDYISAKKMRENYEGNVFSPMGCRSFLGAWKNENGEYKFEGRFNKGVVSINLPQIGIIANGDEDKFWSLLEERLQLCFEALMCSHNALIGVKSDVSPVHWQYGAIARLKKGETIDKLLYGHYSTISLGYIGLYEVTKLMKGVSHTDPIGEEFAVRVMKKLRETCDKWKAETNAGFALYGSPAESLCYRFARIDKEKFGEIKDITDKGYYTNSYHVDVREKISAFNKFAFESQFQKISSGGAISYVEIPNMRHNLEALEELVKFIYDNIQYA